MLGFAVVTPLSRRGCRLPSLTSYRPYLPVSRSVSRSSRRASVVTASAGSPPAAEPDSAEVRYQDDGTRVVPAIIFVRGTEGETVAGVYGVMDASRELLYVGASRNVAESLNLHVEKHGDDIVRYVRVMTFTLPKAAEMKVIVDTWVRENGSVPRGNLQNWEEHDTQLANEISLLQVEEVAPDKIVSPFEKENVEIEDAPKMLELTAANVDVVLDEVRPFLISDGGNISVKSVNLETRSVELTLEGACGSCSSAAMTMQMGVEKALRAKFGDNIGEVVASSAGDDVSSGLTVEACEAMLDEVRSALRGLGGSVKVLEVDEGEVILSFSGPSNLKYGIELMLKDKMSSVEAVTFE